MDYSLLDTPTNLNGRTVVTSLEGWSRSGTLVEFQTPPKERMVVGPHRGTESAVETVELVSISPDGPLVDSKGATPGETLAINADMMENTEGIGETSPAVILSSLLPGGGEIRTSLLIPHTQLLTPSSDSSGQNTGKHEIIPSSNLLDAETHECMDDRNQGEVAVQVLHKQPPTPVLTIKAQEDDCNPELESAMPAEEDQPGHQVDNVDLEDQVSRKQTWNKIKSFRGRVLSTIKISAKKCISKFLTITRIIMEVRCIVFHNQKIFAILKNFRGQCPCVRAFFHV